MQYALELKNVHYAYHTLEGETYALKDITFSVREGEFIALVGPSGCGKSTLLHLIAGLLTPEKGLIKINGSYHPDNTSGIGYMLQKDELLEWRTIYQNVLLGLEIQHALTARSRALARALLTQYGLNAFANAKAQEYRQYQEQKINELVKEKKLDVVIEKGAVVGGGSDVTDDLIAKMGKASDDQIKEAENAAKAQEQQDAQQNAQQAGQTTAVNTEESAQ